MHGSILHINITLNLLHEEDKRDTCRQGRRKYFFHWHFKICLLERLLYIIGKVQWKMSARLCHFCVCCFRNFLQLIKPRSSLWTGSLVKGRFHSVTSLWTLPAVVRPFQLEPVHRLARKKQLLCLQISTLRR